MGTRGLLRETLRSDRGLILSLWLPIVISAAVFLFPATSVSEAGTFRGSTGAGAAEYQLYPVEFFPGDYVLDEEQQEAYLELLSQDAVVLESHAQALVVDDNPIDAIVVSGDLHENLASAVGNSDSDEVWLKVFGPSEQAVTQALASSSFFSAAEYAGDIPASLELATWQSEGTTLLIVASPGWVRAHMPHISAHSLISGTFMGEPAKQESLDRLINNYGAVTAYPVEKRVMGLDSLNRSTLGFAGSTFGLVLAVLVMVGLALARALRENLAALNVRSALGSSPREIVSQTLVVCLVVWSIPAALACIPVVMLYPNRSVLPIVVSLAVIPALVLGVWISRWLIRGGTKTHAQVSVR